MEEKANNDIDKKNDKQSLGETLKTFVICIIVALLIRNFVFNITKVQGNSMNQTLLNGDILFTEKVTLYFSELKYGDIVVIKAPDASGDNYIKRVIGLEGDEIKIEDGRVLRNGQVLDEGYAKGITYPLEENSSWKVPSGEIFVMGDNRQHSNDSRKFGPINKKSVVGISKYRLFPFNKMGGF